MRTDIKLTYDAYRALPETGPKYQLVDGELLMSPAPTYWHQEVSARLFWEMRRYVEQEELGKVLYSPLDVILSDEDVFQPDIVFVSTARRGIIVTEGIRGVPDLCVEVLSPSTRDLDLKTKRLIYARHGVPELWIVDPDANTFRVFRLREDPHRAAALLRAKDTLTTRLLPGFTMKLDKLFAK
jgi:Uma2 family endonuclease